MVWGRSEQLGDAQTGKGMVGKNLRSRRGLEEKRGPKEVGTFGV